MFDELHHYVQYVEAIRIYLTSCHIKFDNILYKVGDMNMIFLKVK